jgi:ATP-binding cassette subfamily B protein
VEPDDTRSASPALTLRDMARRAGGWLPVIGIASLLGTATTLALPAVLGNAVDAIVSTGDTSRWVATAVGLVVLGLVSEIVGAYAGTVSVAGATAWLRGSTVRHILAIPPPASRRFETGDLVSRVSGDSTEAASAGPALVTIASSVVPPIGSVALLALIHPSLAVAFAASAIFVLLVLIAFTRRTADVMTSYQQAQGKLAGRLSESLSGARTIAAAGTLQYEEQRVLDLLPDLRRHGVRTWQALARAVGQSGVVGPLVLVSVVAVAGFQLSDGAITPGDLLAASQYAVLGAGLGGMTGVFAELARARAGVRRLGEVFEVVPTHYGNRTLPSGRGRLEFHGVSVYGTDNAALLSDVDLSLPAGGTVAVVGPSGAGKTVFAEIAARLRDPDFGSVWLDGVPLPELTHDALRNAVGVAFERPELAGATIADAIGPAASRDQVERAARASHAHGFISRLPHGYDTKLADAPMSGGEKQRIGLARAWHAERVVVLDDATSSLDMVTEMEISRTLTNGSLGRTTRLIITHRAATAARADLVIWLDRGRVRGCAAHDQLLTSPEYVQVFG